MPTQSPHRTAHRQPRVTKTQVADQTRQSTTRHRRARRSTEQGIFGHTRKKMIKAKQKRPKNRPKWPRNGPKLTVFGCTRERRAAENERRERQHRPCYTKAPSSPVPPGGFQGAEMADILLRSRRSPHDAKTTQKQGKTAQKRTKTGHFWVRE